MQSAFNFRLEGTRKGIAEKLKQQKPKPDETQIDLLNPVCEFINNEIGKMDPKFNGALVICSGELNKMTGRVVANIQIYAKTIHV